MRDTMSGSHKHLFDDGDGDDDGEEEDEVYMYLIDINPNERVDYRVACRTSIASE